MNLIFQFISAISKFMDSSSFSLSCVEHEKSFITSRPDPEIIKLFSGSAQLRLKFILLIHVKMPTIVGKQDKLLSYGIYARIFNWLGLF